MGYILSMSKIIFALKFCRCCMPCLNSSLVPSRWASRVGSGHARGAYVQEYNANSFLRRKPLRTRQRRHRHVAPTAAHSSRAASSCRFIAQPQPPPPRPAQPAATAASTTVTEPPAAPASAAAVSASAAAVCRRGSPRIKCL